MEKYFQYIQGILLLVIQKNKEGNRNKNTMELPKTGEKYNGLPVYVGLFTAIASIIGLKKNKF